MYCNFRNDKMSAGFVKPKTPHIFCQSHTPIPFVVGLSIQIVWRLSQLKLTFMCGHTLYIIYSIYGLLVYICIRMWIHVWAISCAFHVVTSSMSVVAKMKLPVRHRSAICLCLILNIDKVESVNFSVWPSRYSIWWIAKEKHRIRTMLNWYTIHTID